MNRNHFFVSTAAAAIACVALVGCSSSDSSSDSVAESAPQLDGVTFDQDLHNSLPQSIKDSGTLSIGALWETPPWIGVEPTDSSKPVGAVPDLGEAVGQILGVDIEWKNLQWPAQLPGLQSGNVDVLWGQISDGAEREKSVVDIVGTFQDPLGLLLPEGNPKSFGSLSDACGSRIAVPIGAQQLLAVNENSVTACTDAGKPAITPVEFPSAQAAIVALRAGSVDGWMDSVSSLSSVVDESSGAFTSIQLPSEEVDPYMETILGAAVSKSNPELSEALLGAIHDLEESGFYGQVLDTWNASSAALPADRMQVNIYSATPAGETF